MMTCDSTREYSVSNCPKLALDLNHYGGINMLSTSAYLGCVAEEVSEDRAAADDVAITPDPQSGCVCRSIKLLQSEKAQCRIKGGQGKVVEGRMRGRIHLQSQPAALAIMPLLAAPPDKQAD
jgi:small ligand-binding sensory domain FIST